MKGCFTRWIVSIAVVEVGGYQLTTALAQEAAELGHEVGAEPRQQPRTHGPRHPQPPQRIESLDQLEQDPDTQRDVVPLHEVGGLVRHAPWVHQQQPLQVAGVLQRVAGRQVAPEAVAEKHHGVQSHCLSPQFET